MKPKDLFTLAVRILGLVMIYHVLTTVPLLFHAPFEAWLYAAFYLAAAWWLLTTRWLIRLVYPDEQPAENKNPELAAGLAKKTDA